MLTFQEWPWKPNPDYTRTMKALLREGDAHFVPQMEFGFDPEIMAAILEESNFPESDDPELKHYALDQKIRLFHLLGYDVICQGPELPLPGLLRLEASDTALFTREKRQWADEKSGAITNWEEFEHYSWPDSRDAGYEPLEYLAKHLPDGMAIIAGVTGIFEPLMYLMGLETLALSLYDNPDLVRAICDRISELFLPIARNLIGMDRVIGLTTSDDMGHKTGTLVDPRFLRKYVFPYHKALVACAHAQDLPFILHSCGRLDSILEDLIEDIKIDAIHSFQDVITPVETFSERYSDRIAIVGGLDVDLLARGSEEAIRTRTRQILGTCAPSRAYISGSGNSITNYIPVQNYLAMVDETWRFNHL
jgi:uroporphyrinogen decarboxylase